MYPGPTKLDLILIIVPDIEKADRVWGKSSAFNPKTKILF